MSDPIAFDLLEYQGIIRECKNGPELYSVTDTLCNMFDRRMIGRHELDELKASIDKRFEVLNALKKSIEEITSPCAE